MRIAVAERAKAYRGEPFLRALQRLLAWGTLDFEADGNIVDRCLPWEAHIGLNK